MKILPELVSFEWDLGNSDKNLVKHNVTNKETEEVFNNKPLVFEDVKHSKVELRFHALGKTENGRFLFISFTSRGNKIRIISARDASKKERRTYISQAKAS